MDPELLTGQIKKICTISGSDLSDEKICKNLLISRLLFIGNCEKFFKSLASVSIFTYNFANY